MLSLYGFLRAEDWINYDNHIYKQSSIHGIWVILPSRRQRTSKFFGSIQYTPKTNVTIDGYKSSRGQTLTSSTVLCFFTLSRNHFFLSIKK